MMMLPGPDFHPALPFFAGGLLALFLRGRLRQILQIAIPLAAFWFFLNGSGTGTELGQILPGLQIRLALVREDALARLFVLAFILFGFLSHLFSLHEKQALVPAASNFYIGGAIGAVLAGDLITLFIFWELMALASAMLIWNPAKAESSGALFRYLLVHLTGGLFLFAGIVLHILQEGSIAFEALSLNPAGILIFISFAINAAFVPFHAWMPDAYPEGTPSGSVYLSVFTSKVAVYAFARAFAGQEILIPLGLAAAVYGVIYALMENNMRRLLSYHIICQVGYMVVGIGLGTAAGVNAGTAHAVGNILFKGLLFMSTGALIHATGCHRLSDLGGLARRHAGLVVLYLIGALAISGMPLLNGYVSKSLLLHALKDAHAVTTELILLIVAVGTFLSIACKLAYFAFWGDHAYQDSWKPIPWNMTAAMVSLAGICILIGFFPAAFFQFLPHPEKYHPYSLGHILHTSQMLLGTLLGFLLILPYLHTHAKRTLDVDWFYRLGSRWFVRYFCEPTGKLHAGFQEWLSGRITRFNGWMESKVPPQQIPPVGNALLLMMQCSLAVSAVILLLQWWAD